MAKENSVIDWEAYGTLLKAARLANGYSRGKKLTERGWRRRRHEVLGAHDLRSWKTLTQHLPPDSSSALQRSCPELCDRNTAPAFRKADIKVMLVTLP